MQHPIRMAEVDRLQKLIHKTLNRNRRQSTSITVGIHVLFEIFIHVFENQHQLVLGVDDVVQGQDVFVLELFHERDFADGGARCAFFGIEMDFFEGDKFAGLAVAAFENLGVVSYLMHIFKSCNSHVGG